MDVLAKLCLLMIVTISTIDAFQRKGYYSYKAAHYKPLIESSINYDQKHVCKDCHYYEKLFVPLTYLFSQALFGTYFLLSAIFCAILSTCSSYSTTYVTVSVTSTSISSTSITAVTTTTSTSSTTTTTTTSSTSTETTSSTTVASATTTTPLTITESTTTSPVTTTTATSTATTVTFTQTTTTSTSITTTISTSTKMQSNNGNGRVFSLNEDFWKAIMDADYSDWDNEIIPTARHSTTQLFTTLVDSDPEMEFSD